MKNTFEINIYKKSHLSVKAIAIVLLIFALFASVWQNIDVIIMINRKAHYDNYMKALEEKKEREGLQVLKEQNSDFIAWITVEDVGISLPVVETSIDRQEYYLNHDFDKKENPLGTPYQKYGCDVESTTNTCFIGHSSYNIGSFGNVVSQSIFGTLNQYLSYNTDYTYKIKVSTLNYTYYYEIFSVIRFNIKQDHSDELKLYNSINLSNETTFNRFVNSAKSLSVINFNKEVTFGDRFLTLFTCSTDNLNYRVMVIAKMVS